MAKFLITNKGKALQAKVLAGTCKYEFTKIALGDGFADSEDDYADLNDLMQRKVDVEISDIYEITGGICEIVGAATNTGLTEALYIREAGLYAKDPDDGEILFCVNYYERPSVLDAASEGPYSKEFLFQIGIDSASEINLTVSGAGLITKDTLMTILNRHFTVSKTQPTGMLDQGVWVEPVDDETETTTTETTAATEG